MIRTDNVLIAPIVTEKTVAAPGKYTFQVHPEANKKDVKMAVEHFYGVDIVAVNITNARPKERMVGRGRLIEKRAAYKKATVTLKSGSTLNFNDMK